MCRTSVFLMTMTVMVMAASASAQSVEVSGTIGWTFSDGVNGNARRYLVGDARYANQFELATGISFRF